MIWYSRRCSAALPWQRMVWLSRLRLGRDKRQSRSGIHSDCLRSILLTGLFTLDRVRGSSSIWECCRITLMSGARRCKLCSMCRLKVSDNKSTTVLRGTDEMQCRHRRRCLRGCGCESSCRWSNLVSASPFHVGAHQLSPSTGGSGEGQFGHAAVKLWSCVNRHAGEQATRQLAFQMA